jgi:hypothetical protein
MLWANCNDKVVNNIQKSTTFLLLTSSISKSRSWIQLTIVLYRSMVGLEAIPHFEELETREGPQNMESSQDLPFSYVKH